MEGVGDDTGRLVRLELQNEVLLAMEDGEVLAMVPDIISVIGSDSGHPVPTEGLRLGQRVVFVAHRGPPGVDHPGRPRRGRSGGVRPAGAVPPIRRRMARVR